MALASFSTESGLACLLSALAVLTALAVAIYLIELQHSLNISTDYDENGSILVKITFSLKNGKSEATIHDAGGKFSYYNLNGENLESINFNEQDLTNTIGSFHKALKALIILDRQQVNIVKSDNILIDRASFGLAEVN